MQNNELMQMSEGLTPCHLERNLIYKVEDQAAETARDVSKQRGRNNIHVLDMEDSKLLQRKEQIRWVGRIQDGLRDNRFRLYAQSIEPMSPRTGRQHYEILLRLQDKDD